MSCQQHSNILFRINSEPLMLTVRGQNLPRHYELKQRINSFNMLGQFTVFFKSLQLIMHCSAKLQLILRFRPQCTTRSALKSAKCAHFLGKVVLIITKAELNFQSLRFNHASMVNLRYFSDFGGLCDSLMNFCHKITFFFKKKELIIRFHGIFLLLLIIIIRLSSSHLS